MYDINKSELFNRHISHTWRDKQLIIMKFI